MEGSEESKRNISDKWIDNNVYQALETIELCERRMVNGCQDLMEYLEQMNIGLHRLPEIQLQNMRIMIEEFNILIENTKEIVKDNNKEERELLNSISKTLIQGRKQKDKTLIMVYETPLKKVRGKKLRVMKLTFLFGVLSLELQRLRSKMVKNLSSVLFLKFKKDEHRGED